MLFTNLLGKFGGGCTKFPAFLYVNFLLAYVKYFAFKKMRHCPFKELITL